MKKVEEELDAAGLIKTPQNPDPRQFTYADIGKLRYLDWCIKVSTTGAVLARISCNGISLIRLSSASVSICWLYNNKHGSAWCALLKAVQCAPVPAGEHEAAAGGGQLPEACCCEGHTLEQWRAASRRRQHRDGAVQHVSESCLGMEEPQCLPAGETAYH